MIIKGYQYFEKLEVDASTEIEIREIKNFQSVVTGSKTINFKVIKLSLSEEMEKRTGIVDGGAEIIVKKPYTVLLDEVEHDIIELIKESSAIDISGEKYVLEKTLPSDHTDYQSFILKEAIYDQ